VSTAKPEPSTKLRNVGVVEIARDTLTTARGAGPTGSSETGSKTERENVRVTTRGAETDTARKTFVSM
jgi:hypothetical protein